ncbi:MAG: hypothetical protein R3282_10115 [Rhodothermales bacterium]|nr:hypothetical protein [Rhodothermales bacterium]
MLAASGTLTAAVGIFLAGAGFAAIFPYVLGLVGDLFPNISGTAFGAAFVIALIGGSLFPYLVGVLGDAIGLRLALMLIPASLAASALLLRLFKRDY